MHPLQITGYEVTIAAGALTGLGDLVANAAPASRYAVISDETVASLHGARAVASLPRGCAELLVIPAGEREKTRERWTELTDELVRRGFGRDSAVIALGGGVIGDLAGFVAATYMRGIPYVQVPTTLLAMVDASVGGKTGVDTPAGKNLVGAFHRPAAVLADTELLSTLPERELAAGCAEILKHGVIASEAYFERALALLPAVLEQRDPQALSELVQGSIEIKAGVVARDELERGERKVLNFGHTIAHAIELLTGYALLHGEAVAVGMVVESACGELLGLTAHGTSKRIATAAERASLPTRIPLGIDGGALINATARDKKARGGTVEYALPLRIGAMAGAERGWGTPVPPEIVQRAIG